MDQQAILDALDAVHATLKDFDGGCKLTPDLDEAIAVLGPECDPSIQTLRQALVSPHAPHRRHNTRKMIEVIEPRLRRLAGLPRNPWLR